MSANCFIITSTTRRALYIWCLSEAPASQRFVDVEDWGGQERGLGTGRKGDVGLCWQSGNVRGMHQP